MLNFLSGIKAVYDLIKLLRSLWDEYNAMQERKRQAEAAERAAKREEIEKEFDRGNLSLEEKRKLLSDLVNNLPY